MILGKHKSNPWQGNHGKRGKLTATAQVPGRPGLLTWITAVALAGVKTGLLSFTSEMSMLTVVVEDNAGMPLSTAWMSREYPDTCQNTKGPQWRSQCLLPSGPMQRCPWPCYALLKTSCLCFESLDQVSPPGHQPAFGARSFFVARGWSVHCRMFSSTPGLYPLEVNVASDHLSEKKMSPNTARCPPAVYHPWLEAQLLAFV